MHNEKRKYNISIALKNGDEKIFRSIFQNHFEILETFANTYVGDGEIAKDLVQDVFFQLWKRRTSLPDDLNIKSYLYQATRNNCLNYLKRLKVQLRYEHQKKDSYRELLLNMEALEQLNFNSLAFNELQKLIKQAINQLPPKCKEVFEFSRYEGMKNREIAQLLNISEKAVEGHISKALKHLRAQLKDQYPGEILLCFLVRK